MAGANLLRPFGSLPQNENRLTWAFLVALKYDPFLQNYLRELVVSKLPLKAREHSNSWETARVSTQTKGIDSSIRRLVSILLTDEIIDDILVDWSDRDAVYDGVIEYPNGLTLIVENKPSSGNVWPEQLRPSRNSFVGDIENVRLRHSAICLEWSEVLEGVQKYADSGIAPFSSRKILRDLLSFVEEFHPSLTPYRTFSLCGNRLPALRRRTVRLVDALASRAGLEIRDNWDLFRPQKIAERIRISVEPEPMLTVNLWPADTVRQARHFYEMVDRTAFLGLDDWKVGPNLHFSYMNQHQVWAETRWANSTYFDYFEDGQVYGKMDQARLVPLAEQWES